MRISLWIPALLAAVLALPAAAQPADSVHPGQRVIDFSRKNRTMNDAIARARETVGELLRRLEAPADSGVTITVKLRVAEGDVAEHMWLRDVRYEGGMIHGRLNNVPRDLRRVRLGDALQVAPDQVSDWMVIDAAGALCGGFTFRVSLSQMTGRDQLRVLRQQGIRALPADGETCATPPAG